MGDDEERAELIGAAFALLTAKLEDATGLAVEGQAGSGFAPTRSTPRSSTCSC